MSDPTDATPDALTAEDVQIPEFKPSALPPNLLQTADPQDIWIMQQLDVQRQQNQEIMRQQRINRRELIAVKVRVASIEIWRNSLTAKTAGLIFIAITIAAAFLAYVGQAIAKRIIPFVFIFLAVVGCSWNAPKQKKIQTAQEERAREIMQAAKSANEIGKQRQAIAVATLQDTNSIARFSAASMAYDLSGDYLRRGQSVVGLPAADQNQVVLDLLSEVKSIRTAAEAKERKRSGEEAQWAAQIAELNRRLIEMGQKYEEEKNRNIVKRVWRWAVSTLGIGGLIALCIFFPAAIPIITRVVGWLATKFPAMAKSLGVVGLNAYDSIIRGVERSKAELHKDDPEKADILLENLSKEMDSDHKKLVASRIPGARIALAT